MKNSGFVHLHVHTGFSLSDGACRIEDLVDAAVSGDMRAVAVTDHGAMYGIPDFCRIASRKGVKPIIGCEVYLTRDDSPERRFPPAKSPPEPWHLVLLAANDEGYLNLMRLVSLSHMRKPESRFPVIAKGELSSMKTGLIALSACRDGEITGRLAEGNIDRAVEAAGEFADMLGTDCFFIELNDHGLESDHELVRRGLEVAARTGLSVVATNDVHYLLREHAQAHDLLMAVRWQSQKTVPDRPRPRFHGSEYYFKSAEEMTALFSEIPQAIRATLEIGERCDVEIETGRSHFPHYRLPPGVSPADCLRGICRDGLRSKLGIEYAGAASGGGQDEVIGRLARELQAIERAGYVNYFLVVRDYVEFARGRGIPVGVRGTGAGSLVAWLAGITEIDPLRHSLLFERFMNPAHGVPPDFDIEVCQDRRREVMEYVWEKYGRQNVAHAPSFVSFGSRHLVHDLAKASGLPQAECERLSRLVPDEPGLPLEAALSRQGPLRDECAHDGGFASLMDKALVLDGLCRSVSAHPTGIVMAGKALSGIVPLTLDRDGHTMIQYPVDRIAEMGLVKMDIVGSRALALICRALSFLNPPGAVCFELPASLPDDPAMLGLLERGDTFGIPHLDTPAMTDMLRRIGVKRFEDVAAALSMNRPNAGAVLAGYISGKDGHDGNAAGGRQPLDPILAGTRGVVLYQEQVQQAAISVAGYSPEEADLFRRALCGKDLAEAEGQRDRFVAGCRRRRRMGEDAADSLFDRLAAAAGQVFCKAHSVSLAWTACRAAWLKAHHPVEFMAALLTNEAENTDRLGECLRETGRMGIAMLPPDVNRSGFEFRPEGKAVRFGLLGLRGIGAVAARAITAERDRGGAYTGLVDFCVRQPASVANHRILDVMVREGCFDSGGLPRNRLVNGIKIAAEYAQSTRGDMKTGQQELFDVKSPRDQDILPEI